MVKKLLTTFSVVILLALSASDIKAVTLDPSGGNKGAASVETIKIIASPASTTDVVVRLKLHLENATVVDFSSTLSAFGTCEPSGGNFTDTDLCVDLAKLAGSYIQNGEEIGSLRVRWGNPGTATITKLSGTGYYNSTTLVESLGVAGTYVIGNVPNTALELPIDTRIILIFLGLASIYAGVNLKKLKRKINENI